MTAFDRDLLFRASAIGRRFEFSVLAADSTADVASVRAALERACRLQLIVRDDDGERYAFRHALAREIVYAELLSARTRPVHRRITLTLERLGGAGTGRLCALAYQSWAAGDATRALRYNELAGDAAVALYAWDDARHYYKQAQSVLRAHSPAFARIAAKLRALNDDGVDPA